MYIYICIYKRVSIYDDRGTRRVRIRAHDVCFFEGFNAPYDAPPFYSVDTCVPTTMYASIFEGGGDKYKLLFVREGLMKKDNNYRMRHSPPSSPPFCFLCFTLNTEYFATYSSRRRKSNRSAVSVIFVI